MVDEILVGRTVEVIVKRRTIGPWNEEESRFIPNYTIPVGLRGTVLREGVAQGLLGVVDGEHICILESWTRGCVDLIYVPVSDVRVVQCSIEEK